MSNAVLSRVRIFPLLILFAFVALGVRGINLYTGYSLLIGPASAQEQEGDNSESADAQAATDNGQAQTDTNAAPQERPRQPLVVGLPSNEEMELITQLRERRQELERRETQLDLQEQLLASTEKRINDKIQQLEVLETRIKEHLRIFETAEDQKLQDIVKVYETMKPKDAAPRFEALALQTQIDLVSKMKPSKVAALMGEMSPQAASILTTELATLAQPPRIQDLNNEGN
ncbi:MotE family protein [Kordiimonas sp.]|uniref:MotE family protein n=1 Tax=Kordiimonas sp. TaxID=1970157 RepID=UPI003A924D87